MNLVSHLPAGRSIMNEALLNRIKRSPALPSLPTVAVEVVNLAQQADVDVNKIAEIISNDPALSSKVLRTVNSSFYARQHKVATLSQAVVILGLQSVKTLVLGFSLVRTLQEQQNSSFDYMSFWKRSLYAGAAARILANEASLVQEEEAFLAALLQDLGMLVLDQVLGEEYRSLVEGAKTHAEVLEREKATLGATHADVAAALCDIWKLPPVLSVPIAHHHNPEDLDDPHLQRISALVGLAGACGEVFVCASDGTTATLIGSLRDSFRELLDLDQEQCDAVMKRIGESSREVAELFEMKLTGFSDFEEVLARANEALVELTLQTHQEAAALEEQNKKLKVQVHTDALTGLSNRARFDEFLAETLAACIKARRPVALLLVDIDHFKKVNDTFGHQAGDAVLRQLGKLLGSSIREGDVAARYGGEEMAMVLPGTDDATATALADAICRSIAVQPMSFGPATLPVTVSVGVATWSFGSPLDKPAYLLKAADMALYNAKHSGRNCVKVFRLKKAAA